MTDSTHGKWDDGNSESEIVFAVDELHEEHSNMAIIADITKDDAWIASNLVDAALLEEWR